MFWRTVKYTTGLALKCIVSFLCPTTTAHSSVLDICTCVKRNSVIGPFKPCMLPSRQLQAVQSCYLLAFCLKLFLSYSLLILAKQCTWGHFLFFHPFIVVRLLMLNCMFFVDACNIDLGFFFFECKEQPLFVFKRIYSLCKNPLSFPVLFFHSFPLDYWM